MTGTVIQYNILKNGDKPLKGKIGEMVFERIAAKFFPNGFLVSRTYEVQMVFRLFHGLKYCKVELVNSSLGSLVEVIKQLQQGRNIVEEALAAAERKLNDAKQKAIKSFQALGLNMVEVHPVPQCLYCGRDIRDSNLQPTREVVSSYVACQECASKIGRAFASEEIINNMREVAELQSLSHELRVVNDHHTCIRLLSCLNKEEFEFLKNLYDNSLGQPTFDYVGLDGNGGKFLIEVKSVCGAGVISLSKRQKNHVEKAKAVGFQVLVPLLRYGEDWNILIELKLV